MGLQEIQISDIFTHSFQHPSYFMSSEFLSASAVNEMLEKAQNYGYQEAQIGSNGRLWVDNVQRKSKVAFLPPQGKAFEKMKRFALDLNKKYWNFKLPFQYCRLQVARYGKGEFFNWHQDLYDFSVQPRIITVVVQANDPSTFSGGKLEVQNWNGTTEKLDLKQFQMAAFSSCVYHRVTEVTHGCRFSLALSIKV